MDAAGLFAVVAVVAIGAELTGGGGKLTDGARRPALKRTPQALQSVLCPAGPARHCGVLVVPQCTHRRAVVGAMASATPPDALGLGDPR